MSKWMCYYVREQIFAVVVDADTETEALSHGESILNTCPDPSAFKLDDGGFEPDYAINSAN